MSQHANDDIEKFGDMRNTVTKHAYWASCADFTVVYTEATAQQRANDTYRG